MYQQSRTINRIDSQIAALEEKKLRLLAMPEDKYEEEDVVWFRKRFGSHSDSFTYAAIKHGGRWYLTHSTGHSRSPLTWEDLLDFVGDNEMWAATEWESIQ